MNDILTNLETRIVRKVRDIDHMILCDGYQYGMITYRNGDQLVRRPRSGMTWRFVMDLKATIKEDKEREKAWQAEQEMQALDAKLDPDGLDKEGQQAWEEYQDELGYADKDIIVEGNSEEFCGEF